MKRWSDVGPCIAVALFAWGCGETARTERATGGETHFLTCTVDSDCESLSSGYQCVTGVCRVAPEAVGAGIGGVSTSSMDVPGECPRVAIEGPEVVVLGDTFMALTHQITAELESAARARGALSPDHSYRDRSTVIDNAFALGGSGLAEQYSRAIADGPVEVVIMNGGGSDVLLGHCAEPVEGCPVIAGAVDGARQLFARMASDGVEHVVYAYYPDPEIPPVREKVDAMRPLMQAVCTESVVPCHWVDLRTTFAGHDAEYITGDGLNPTDAGSRASAIAIGDSMRRHCIAQ